MIENDVLQTTPDAVGFFRRDKSTPGSSYCLPAPTMSLGDGTVFRPTSGRILPPVNDALSHILTDTRASWRACEMENSSSGDGTEEENTRKGLINSGAEDTSAPHMSHRPSRGAF